MYRFTRFGRVKKALTVLLVVCGCWGNFSQAALVSTNDLINAERNSYTQVEFQTALESEELKSRLQALGVDVGQLEDRIASLTPNEIHQLNAELDKQPAGGLLGALLTVFVVLVITDMLCATDVFTFVRCINK